MNCKRKYFIALGTGIVLAVLVALYRGFSFSLGMHENCGALSDGGFVTGAIFLCIGLLTKGSESGFFDIFSYGSKNLFGRFAHPGRRDENYYDYRQKKAEERKPALYHLIYAGLTLIVFSVVMLILYGVLAPQA